MDPFQHPADKWSKQPSGKLVSRLNDITSEILLYVDDPDPGDDRSELSDEKLCDLMIEAHWISEELEHRINRTEYAGLLDIMIESK